MGCRRIATGQPADPDVSDEDGFDSGVERLAGTGADRRGADAAATARGPWRCEVPRMASVPARCRRPAWTPPPGCLSTGSGRPPPPGRAANARPYRARNEPGTRRSATGARLIRTPDKAIPQAYPIGGALQSRGDQPPSWRPTKVVPEVRAEALDRAALFVGEARPPAFRPGARICRTAVRSAAAPRCPASSNTMPADSLASGSLARGASVMSAHPEQDIGKVRHLKWVGVVGAAATGDPVASRVIGGGDAK